MRMEQVSTRKVIIFGVTAGLYFMLQHSFNSPQFNAAYNFNISNLQTATTQGLMLLIFTLSTIGTGLTFWRNR